MNGDQIRFAVLDKAGVLTEPIKVSDSAEPTKVASTAEAELVGEGWIKLHGVRADCLTTGIWQ